MLDALALEVAQARELGDGRRLRLVQDRLGEVLGVAPQSISAAVPTNSPLFARLSLSAVPDSAKAS